MSVNSEKLEILELETTKIETPKEEPKNTRVIPLKDFYDIYRHLQSEGETLGRRDFTINVRHKFDKYAKSFHYSDVNIKTGEAKQEPRIMRVGHDIATIQLCRELEVGCNYRILSWKKNKTYTWVAATKIDQHLKEIK